MADGTGAAAGGEGALPVVTTAAVRSRCSRAATCALNVRSCSGVLACCCAVPFVVAEPAVAVELLEGAAATGTGERSRSRFNAAEKACVEPRLCDCGAECTVVAGAACGANDDASSFAFRSARSLATS